MDHFCNCWIIAYFIKCNCLQLFREREKGKNAEAKESKIPEVQEYGGIHLEQVGDKVRQKNWGTFTLLETKSINESFELAPMVITIKDIRRIQLSSLTDEAKEELKSYTGLSFEEAYSIYYKENISMEEIDQRAALSKTDIDEKVPYLEITYSVENKDSKELQFFRMENVTLMMILHMMCLLKISSIPGIHLWGQKK